MTVDFVTQNSYTLGNTAFAEANTVTGLDAIIVEAAVPAAVAGTLTTRTSDTAGVITVVAHSWVGGETVDIYWVGGQCRNATIDSETTTTLTFSGAVGDVLPAVDFAVTICEQVSKPFDLVGDDCTALAMFSAEKCTIRLLDAVGEELVKLLATGGTVWAWYTGNGDANPIAADTIITVTFSHDAVTETAMRVGAQT